MGYIYTTSHYLDGFQSKACVGRVDEQGYVYTDYNHLNGFSSKTCVGRVDEQGYVYNDYNHLNGLSSKTCVGRVDEQGYVYNDYNHLNGFSSKACVGRVDEQGYVYNDYNAISGMASKACVAQVDGDFFAAGAAFLLLIMPKLAQSSDSNKKSTPATSSANRAEGQTKTSQKQEEKSTTHTKPFPLGALLIQLVLVVAIFAFMGLCMYRFGDVILGKWHAGDAVGSKTTTALRFSLLFAAVFGLIATIKKGELWNIFLASSISAGLVLWILLILIDITEHQSGLVLTILFGGFGGYFLALIPSAIIGISLWLLGKIIRKMFQK